MDTEDETAESVGEPGDTEPHIWSDEPAHPFAAVLWTMIAAAVAAIIHSIGH